MTLQFFEGPRSFGHYLDMRRTLETKRRLGTATERMEAEWAFIKVVFFKMLLSAVQSPMTESDRELADEVHERTHGRYRDFFGGAEAAEGEIDMEALLRALFLAADDIQYTVAPGAWETSVAALGQHSITKRFPS